MNSYTSICEAIYHAMEVTCQLFLPQKVLLYGIMVIVILENIVENVDDEIFD